MTIDQRPIRKTLDARNLVAKDLHFRNVESVMLVCVVEKG